MGVLTSQQTTQAVRALIYFGLHDYFAGEMDLGDCRAVITSNVTQAGELSLDKEDPVEEFVEVHFQDVEHDRRKIDGRITVNTKVRWPSLYERLRVGSPRFQIIEQPEVKDDRLTKNCLVAFSRLIPLHKAEVDRFKETMAENEEASAKD